MSKNNPNTEEILDAIKNMMSERPIQHNQDLPKDVIELTNPINESENKEDEKLDILELSNPISDEKNPSAKNEDLQINHNRENLISNEQIKRAVRNAIDTLPSSKLDEIINEELTRIIQERLNSSIITVSTENKKK